MPKFNIKYYFDGNGEVEIEAKNEDEARDLFFSGDYLEKENEWGENYNVENIEEICFTRKDKQELKHQKRQKNYKPKWLK